MFFLKGEGNKFPLPLKIRAKKRLPKTPVKVKVKQMY